MNNLEKHCEEKIKKQLAKKMVAKIITKYIVKGSIIGGIGGTLVSNYFNQPTYFSIIEGSAIGMAIGVISSVYAIEEHDKGKEYKD